ncbi:unnamed protein product, partial [Timema podura]|nr:unnamed protein product [Timema podura]
MIDLTVLQIILLRNSSLVFHYSRGGKKKIAYWQLKAEGGESMGEIKKDPTHYSELDPKIMK